LLAAAPYATYAPAPATVAGLTIVQNGSIAAGDHALASGLDSVALGAFVAATNGSAFAAGSRTHCRRNLLDCPRRQHAGDRRDSTAMGGSTVASGTGSTAMGDETQATGDYSTAMGDQTTASGYDSTAMGFFTTASGSVSTALGEGTTASGEWSTAMEATRRPAETIPRRSVSCPWPGQGLLRRGLACQKRCIRVSFVWADSTDADFSSTANDQFLIRAAGGVTVVGDLRSPASSKPVPASRA